MNRIRYWREKRGLSQPALARLLDMSQANLSRLETGKQQLTEDLMQRLAEALDVAPIDLLPLAIVAALQDDVAAANIDAAPEVAAVLKQRQIRGFRVLTDVVESRGISPSGSLLIDTSPAALEAIRTGDLVVAEVVNPGKPERAYMVLREFIAPALLTTNRRGANHAFRTDDESLSVRLVGVVIPTTDF